MRAAPLADTAGPRTDSPVATTSPPVTLMRRPGGVDGGQDGGGEDHSHDQGRATLRPAAAPAVHRRVDRQPFRRLRDPLLQLPRPLLRSPAELLPPLGDNLVGRRGELPARL